jgi:hypothetical protein
MAEEKGAAPAAGNGFGGLPAGWARLLGSLSAVAAVLVLFSYLVIVGVQSHQSSWDLLRQSYLQLSEQRQESKLIVDRIEERLRRIEALLEKRPKD